MLLDPKLARTILPKNATLLFLVALSALLAVGVFGASEETWPSPDWPRARPVEVGMNARLLKQARDYALVGDGAGMILRHGRLVLQWGDVDKRYDLKSTTKSFGATALAIALKDGKIASLDDPVRKYYPGFGTPPESNVKGGRLDKITLFHLATQTAGFDKPGGYQPLLFDPGAQWSYSDGGPNWLAECLTLLYKKDLNTVMFERVFTPIGIKPADLSWRKNAYRPREIEGVARREFGSGIHADVDAMARIGYLYLREGRWRGRRILPASFVALACATPEQIRGLPVVREKTYPGASNHYGLLWWNNADGSLSSVPRDAFWSWGLYDSLIVVIPSLDIVVTRAGRSMAKGEGALYEKLAPFLGPIAQSVGARPPYPPSATVERLEWAPASTIIRKAAGSDNWPLTWMDDGALFTAYGDGLGFKPKLKEKLSLGFARIEGGAEDFRGLNLRSATGEKKGDGAKGLKASGLLMVDGVLYMWVRNAGNSRLAWSSDRGKRWTWSDWKFSTSFACPTFLNFGPNYAGARDGYVYVYSPDGDTAYEPADRLLLARVPMKKIRQRESYEFLEKTMKENRPIWTKNLARRGAVFENPGGCGRTTISYNEPLGIYLLCQTPGGDTRFEGGLGVYDAPEPWGPWSTVFFTEKWDVGPGETASFPTKWMTASTLHLVFSGGDNFSVRKASLFKRP